jgi:hypothetical protein
MVNSTQVVQMVRISENQTQPKNTFFGVGQFGNLQKKEGGAFQTQRTRIPVHYENPCFFQPTAIFNFLDFFQRGSSRFFRKPFVAAVQ